MDPVLDRVRAADPVQPSDFAGLADFDALVLDPAPRPRRRRRLLALPAVGAVIAAVVFVPSSGPQAREIVRRASAAVAPPADGILYAKSSAGRRSALDGSSASYGTRRVWVQGDTAMRWLEDSGNEEVYVKGKGTTRFDPRTGKVDQHPDVTMVANNIFHASRLLSDARAGKDVELVGEEAVNGRPAYILRWPERLDLPNTVKIELTLWLDRETYAPLRYTDHSSGLDVNGKPFDETYTENVLEFETLPDTPENRKLLELGPHH
jgi:outer membrane lipoprotein-sorting protein